jgi:2-polyprenyl-3-methyl-5-hydroxy-6-metoxy-1,4-benzoquinol methylase
VKRASWQYDFWQTYPTRFGELAFLAQVGKTSSGKPVPDAVVDRIVDDIATRLALSPADTLLDLGCGNGILSVRLAERCGRVLGVDFSEPLIRVARAHHSRPNVEYILGDLRDVGGLLPDGLRLDKVSMYEVVQHLTPSDIRRTFEALAPRMKRGGRLFVGSVPDRARRFTFYATFRRRLEWALRTVRGRERFGRWWTREELEQTLGSAGFAVTFVPQSEGLHTAQYRFDVLAIMSDRP